MEDLSPSADATPKPDARRFLRSKVDWLIVALALVWGFAGVLKLLDLDSFSDVVRAHGVLPDLSPAPLSIVPIAEIILGVLMLASVGSVRGLPILKTTLLAGCFLLVSFTVYLMLVPGAVLEQVGCGCFGQTSTRLASGIPLSARTLSLLVSGVLLAGHSLGFEHLHRRPIMSSANLCNG